MKLGIHRVLSTNQPQETQETQNLKLVVHKAELFKTPDPFPWPPLTHAELAGTASKAIAQYQEAQHKTEKEVYTKLVETSVQDAFAVVITKGKGYSLLFDKRKDHV